MTASSSEHFVPTPAGRLYARVWNCLRAPGAAPIVLIHDSLGCVELWRDFPERLRDAAQRTVIAYDRLGFGRSDARSDALTSTFVRKEAEIYIPSLLRHFAIDRFVPFGHSVGGGMAICCGAVLAEACVAIITESVQMLAEDKTLEAIARCMPTLKLFSRSGRFRVNRATPSRTWNRMCWNVIAVWKAGSGRTQRSKH